MAGAIHTAAAVQSPAFQTKRELCCEIRRICSNATQGYLKNVGWLDAEDIAQEAILRFLAKGRLKKMGKAWCLVDRRNKVIEPLEPFLRTSAKNLCLDLLRSERHRTKRSEAFHDIYCTGETYTAEDRLQSRRVISSLRPQDRAVLIDNVLNGIDGRSAAQRKRLSRARRALQDREP